MIPIRQNVLGDELMKKLLGETKFSYNHGDLIDCSIFNFSVLSSCNSPPLSGVRLQYLFKFICISPCNISSLGSTTKLIIFSNFLYSKNYNQIKLSAIIHTFHNLFII